MSTWVNVRLTDRSLSHHLHVQADTRWKRKKKTEPGSWCQNIFDRDVKCQERWSVQPMLCCCGNTAGFDIDNCPKKEPCYWAAWPRIKAARNRQVDGLVWYLVTLILSQCAAKAWHHMKAPGEQNTNIFLPPNSLTLHCLLFIYFVLCIADCSDSLVF